jgi:nucleoid DNA-binding protein
MLRRTEIAAQIEELTGIKPNLTKSVLDALAEIAADEIAAGEDFTVPGIARLSWRYKAARKKGEGYKKGETYMTPGGEKVAEADSPARKASVRLAAAPTGEVGRVRPKRAEMGRFLTTKAGKNIAGRSKG